MGPRSGTVDFFGSCFDKELSFIMAFIIVAFIGNRKTWPFLRRLYQCRVNSMSSDSRKFFQSTP